MSRRGHSGGRSNRHGHSGRSNPPNSRSPDRSRARNDRQNHYGDQVYYQQHHDQYPEDAVLNVPVWQEHGSYEQASGYLHDEFGNPHPQNNRVPSFNNSRRKNRLRSTFQEQPATVSDAFRMIDNGVIAESEGRYHAAANDFVNAAEMLSTVVNRDQHDQHVSSLLMQKVGELVQWGEALQDWIDSGMRGSPPPRMGTTVTTNVTGRLHGNLANVRDKNNAEFTHMHYTACSSKVVSEFSKDGYVLQCMKNGRRPQLLVVITMYNEDRNELNMTLRKVANNIEYLKAQKLPGYTDEEAWKNILVVIVSDGRTKANHGTLEFLRDVGLFDEDAMNINMRGVDVQCHIFEYSVQFMNHKASLLGSKKTGIYPPMQAVFALKEHNAGKLNSHEWYFNAFAEQIQPEYTVLLDVGTLPTKTAFYRLLVALEINPQIGGTCGEIAVDKPIPNLCNWVIAAQHFEYKISNIMDKSLESVFGFISVLPGAFSAYRYQAIRGPPLQAYFKSLTTPIHELGPFQGNMYLAEDRILCFELLARKGKNWTMHYVKDAIARTDVPTNLVSLIGQRRRWLNGSFFALVYTILNWGRVYSESSHSYIRKIFLGIQYLYMVLNVGLSWILLSNYFLVVYFLVIKGLQDDRWGFYDTSNWRNYKDQFISVFVGLYGMAFLIQIIAGLGNKPKHISNFYAITSFFYFLVNAFTTLIAVSFVFNLNGGENEKEFGTREMIAAAATVGVFFISALLHCELHHVVLSFIQYMSLLPTFINTLNTYSFCNLHDLSWGTKGLESSDGHGPKQAGNGKGNYKDAKAAQKAEEERKKKEAKIKDEMEGHFQYFRSKLLTFWLLSNLGFGYGIINLDPTGIQYLTFLFYVVACFNAFRLVGSILFLLYHYRQSFFITCGVRSKMKKRLGKRQRKEREAQRRQELGGGLQGITPGPSHPIVA